jgi:peptidoglycan/xylan/chitin deacetylase (PgdA/CDA1 family)
MQTFKTLAVRGAFSIGAPRFLKASPQTSLTTILFHRFVFDDEPKTAARDRLKRQCEWLSANYAALTLRQATDGLKEAKFPPRPLLITIDDAPIDVLDVVDIFRLFDLPVTIFVCAGWSTSGSLAEPDEAAARVVSALEWYFGPDKLLRLPNAITLQIGRAHRAAAADAILSRREEWQHYFEEILSQTTEIRARTSCNWQELTQLKQEGVEFGCHSTSHVNLADASDKRLAFEVEEGKRILDKRLGCCDAFAYPYGIRGSYNSRTADTLKQAGFHAAFVTESAFPEPGADMFRLPRISMPDGPLSLGEFRARVGGGGVVLRRLWDRLSRS